MRPRIMVAMGAWRNWGHWRRHRRHYGSGGNGGNGGNGGTGGSGYGILSNGSGQTTSPVTSRVGIMVAAGALAASVARAPARA